MNRPAFASPALGVLVLLVGVSAPCAAQQEWGTAGNHTFHQNSGSVGIGMTPTDSTAYKLHVENPLGGAIFGVTTGVATWPAIDGIGAANGTGVRGRSASGYGVAAISSYGTAVHAFSADGTGVYAGTDYGTALYARVFEEGLAAKFDGPVEIIHGSLDVRQLNGFVGVGRNYQITGSEVFGTYENTNGYSGMYVATSGEYGDPFYGYSTGGNADAYHYYEGNSGSWRLYVKGGVRLAVGNTGNVGVGVLTPTYKLHVNGSAGKPGGGSWSNSSDRRLKKNVQDLDGSLDKLLAVRGVTYEYKDPEAILELPGVHTGVIAQEVEKVFPEWVDEGPDGFKRVTYRGFEALSVEAMRELRQENAELRQRLEDLEALVATLAETR